MENSQVVYAVSRRDLIVLLGGAAVAWPFPVRAEQQTAAASSLFQIREIDHVSLSVADGQRTIDFYRPIFGQEIYLRPNTQDIRISLGGRPYLAINPGRNFPPGTIDHFCIGMNDSMEQIRSIIAREGIAFTDAAYAKDQDGTIIQILESTDNVLRYPKATAVAGLLPVFRPRGLDQVTVTVTNLDNSSGLYRKFFGPEMQRANNQLVFKIGAGALVVREASRGERPGINGFRVRVDRYDPAVAARRMKMLGAELRFEAASNEPYFTDADGIAVHLAEA